MSHVIRHARRFARLITNLLLISVMLGCAAYIAPAFFGYERYVITGGSMSGTFEQGALAFEKPVPVEDLEVGDVITYLPPPGSGTSSLVTHRITKIRLDEDGNRVFRTQGDANADPDPWKFSLTSETQPVVVQTVPQLGYVFIALADRNVRMVVIGVPAAIIALLALRDLINAVRPGPRGPRRQDESENDSGDDFENPSDDARNLLAEPGYDDLETHHRAA